MKDILKDDMAYLRDKLERGISFDAQDTFKMQRIMSALEAGLDKPAPAKKTTKKTK